MTDAPGETSEEEQLYQETRAELPQREVAAPRRRIPLLLLVTLVLFVLSQYAMGFHLLPVVVGVVFLHEAGHYLAMRVFGYRDLRVFFIPFGAAASGRKHAAPAWQQAIVLMSGPLSGIALAGILYGAFTPPLNGETSASLAIILLVLVNGFSLLPFAPLDGGRLLNLLIFSRRPLLESSFLLFSATGLFAGAWATRSWVLSVVAATVAIAVPFRYRKARRRALLRQELGDLPERLEDLNEEHRHHLFGYARALDPECSDPTECANRIKAVHEEAVARPASIGSSAALLGLYAAGIVACVLIGYLDTGSALGLGARVKQQVNEGVASGNSDLQPLAHVSLKHVSAGKYTGSGRAVDGTAYTLEVSKDQKGYWYTVRDEKGRIVAGGGSSAIGP